jgi:flagellar hook-associated protein 2
MTWAQRCDLTTGILFGTQAALRVESDISRVITARFFGVGQFGSLASVGISLDDKGKMKLDETKLTAAFNSDAAALKTLFTDKNSGLAAKVSSVVEQLAGAKSSLLSSRSDSLTRIIDINNARIEDMNARLDRQRERLLLEFYNLEQTVAKFRDNLAALNSLQIIPPLTSSLRN